MNSNNRRDYREYKLRKSMNERKRVVYRERKLLLSVFALIVMFSVLFFSSKVNAGNFINKGNSNSIKMYKSIMIYAGDSFNSIAKEYMGDEYSSENKYISEILSINGMNEASKLIPGNRIIIPYYMSESIENELVGNPVIEISLANN